MVTASEPSVPTDVKLDAVTPEPRVEPLRTLVPLISYALPVTRLKSSEDVQPIDDQVMVLSVAPLSVIPPPSAVTSVGDATEPNSIFLSSTVKVVEFIVVVVPLTVRSPLRVRAAAAIVPVKVGDAESTTLPVPVEVVTPVPPLATGNVPVTPVVNGNPVALVSVPEAGVPKAPPANNNAPVPLSSVTAAARLALEGVAKNVAIPVPRPLIPVDTGRPVALVSVPEVGVPNAPLNRTGAPAEPVFTASAVAIPVPRPLIPVDTGRPVALVSTAADGVPKLGVVNTGLVDNTTLPEPVDVVTPVPPLATESVPVVPATIGNPVALVNTA